MRTVSLVNLVATGNRGNQVGERTEGGVLTQAKRDAHVSSDQEEKSVKAAEIHLAEKASFIANYFEGSISRKNFLSFDRL